MCSRTEGREDAGEKGLVALGLGGHQLTLEFCGENCVTIPYYPGTLRTGAGWNGSCVGLAQYRAQP